MTPALTAAALVLIVFLCAAFLGACHLLDEWIKDRNSPVNRMRRRRAKNSRR